MCCARSVFMDRKREQRRAFVRRGKDRALCPLKSRQYRDREKVERTGRVPYSGLCFCLFRRNGHNRERNFLDTLQAIPGYPRPRLWEEKVRWLRDANLIWKTGRAIRASEEEAWRTDGMGDADLQRLHGADRQAQADDPDKDGRWRYGQCMAAQSHGGALCR